MACRLFGTKPLSEPMLASCQLETKEHNISMKLYLTFKGFHSRKYIWKYQQKGSHLVSAKDEIQACNRHKYILLIEKIISKISKNIISFPIFKAAEKEKTEEEGQDGEGQEEQLHSSGGEWNLYQFWHKG